VGECFFWYRLTRVVPDKFHRAVKRLCVCDRVSYLMFCDCRITHVSAMLATLVLTVKLTLTSVSRCHAYTTPPAGSGQTSLVLTSAIPMHQALTVRVLLDLLVTCSVLTAFRSIFVFIFTVVTHHCHPEYHYLAYW